MSSNVGLKITKEVIRTCKSKKRQCNEQKKKDERTNSDPQNTTQKKCKGWTQVLRKGEHFLLH